MSKKVFVLVHDYWHHDDSIKPMMDYLFNADYEVTFTKLSLIHISEPTRH